MAKRKKRTVENEIAGVTLQHISDGPPDTFSDERQGYLQALQQRYQTAWEAFRSMGFCLDDHSVLDERFPVMALHASQDQHAPYFTFLVTPLLLRKIRAARRKKGEALTQDELLAIGLAAGRDAVDPRFSTDAMNAINTSYYTSAVAFDPTSRLATMFVRNRPINEAFGALIARAAGTSTVRVKEIASGNNTEHWKYVMQGLAANGVTAVELTLTDFFVPAIAPSLVSEQLHVHAERYSLLDELPSLPQQARFDAILATYGFDSIWSPEDLALTRMGSQWYKTMYRVKVADWAPRRKALLRAMRQRIALPRAKAHEYDGIFLETVMEPIALSALPYAHYIAESKKTFLNYPGSLVRRIVHAFETQLNEAGVVVIGEVGAFGQQGDRHLLASDQRVSGVAARFRMIDYMLTKRILESEHNLRVSLLSLGELSEQYLPKDWAQACSDVERRHIYEGHDTGIMVVGRQ